MTVTRAQVIAEARSWVGTPFHHQGRLKGVGVDCAGLLICVGKALGLSDFDVTGYARVPDGRTLLRHCDEHMTRIPRDEAQPGDVLLMRWRRYPQHVAIVADRPPSFAQERFGGQTLRSLGGGGLNIIHAHEDAGSCVEHRLDETWAARVVQAYRIPGLCDAEDCDAVGEACAFGEPGPATAKAGGE